MVVIELQDVDLPEDVVGLTVLNGNGKVTSIVETSEFTRGDKSLVSCTSLRSHNHGLVLGFVQGGNFASNTATALEDSSSSSSNALLSSVCDWHRLDNQRLFVDVSFREITEAGVLHTGQALVVSSFPALGSSLRNNSLKVILNHHVASHRFHAF